MSTRLTLAETPWMRSQPLEFQVGDTVDVATKIVEGDKERIQLFTGRVIRRRGEGLSANFTVRRIVMGEGVERIFPIHSPRLAGVRVVSRGEVRRSKLYYMRQRVGKATRLREILSFDEAGITGSGAAPAESKPAAPKVESAAKAAHTKKATAAHPKA